jgi:hypothetical protein
MLSTRPVKTPFSSVPCGSPSVTLVNPVIRSSALNPSACASSYSFSSSCPDCCSFNSWPRTEYLLIASPSPKALISSPLCWCCCQYESSTDHQSTTTVVINFLLRTHQQTSTISPAFVGVAMSPNLHRSLSIPSLHIIFLLHTHQQTW